MKIDLDELGNLVRPECIPCTDFSNYTADISVGGLGSPDGYTTTIIRNQLAQSVLEEAIAKRYLQKNIETDLDGVVKEIERMAWKKHKRGKDKRKQLGISD